MTDQAKPRDESGAGLPDVNEERLAEALRLVKQGVQVPGDDFREQLRDESRHEFVRSATIPAGLAVTSESKADESQLSVAFPPATTRRGMRRWLPNVTAAAAMIGVAVWLLQLDTANAAPTFGDVIDRVQKAKSLKLHVTRNGRSHEVFVQGGDSLRWVESESRYQIAKGQQLWRVDDRTKRFNTDTATFFNERGLDLFELLGVTTDLDAALKVQPVEGSQTTRAVVFKFPAKRGNQDVNVEAVVSKDGAWLRNIRVFSIEDDHATSPMVICELEVEAFDEPLDENLFIVAKSLTEDFRVGKIVDSEGVVTVKPVMHERWTPVSREMVLKRGDWIRTDPRGPNAVAVRVNNAKLTLGPGSLVELIDKDQARVHHGEVKVEADQKKSFELFAGKADVFKVEGKKLLRLAGDAFKVLTHTPMWLAGFEGTQSDESMGSLIADVDGRSVPLTVGYHKVTVEIRDQIARTTIEESFVNHTNSRLEGKFYFPLPQDASISGFGMWIGNELVEADVVEKQRAREIFEIILREKRDPGLLEWTGGNIFKARVFPIFPHSEKRIKITYTQVLPLRGNKYRYSYGLRSELLKQTPLRELSIDLKVYSESKLRQISCPSHAARIEQTDHSGHIEFSAEEYSPDADFEAVIEIDGRANDVVVIPHQRGDDGYFMLQLTPPGADGNWQRDLLPDGKPLKLLILADTSSSMDNEHRKTQDELIASLLLSLGPKDQFNLAAVDVECDWVFDKMQAVSDTVAGRAPKPKQSGSKVTVGREKPEAGPDDSGAAEAGSPQGDAAPEDPASPKPPLEVESPESDSAEEAPAVAEQEADSFDPIATPEPREPRSTKRSEVKNADRPLEPGPSVDVARAFLAKRVSLGWTDLDRAFASVLERADEHTHVIYIGDGVVTAGSANPDEFVNRLNRLTGNCNSTFHAITVGNSYETVVLKSIASVGGGSFRRVNAEQGPQDVAKELLSEITQPGLTDLKVQIRGIRVAKMYPEELPNIAAGTQHIIIGRYLPEGEDQRGEVVVTGKRGDATIRYKARFTLNDAEKGNSFIPRLWARAHLDRLLSQGRSQLIQDEVIALSEEYHIMTPYTSFLVLESDADRERFKVKRRFLMRDGEKFFADGRANANYELKQEQMKLAGLWRANLRTQILKSFINMGRRASMLNPWQMMRQWNRGNWKYGKESERAGFGNYGWSGGQPHQELAEKLRQHAKKDKAEGDGFDDGDLETPDDADPSDLEKSIEGDGKLDNGKSLTSELPPRNQPAPVASTPSPDAQETEGDWLGDASATESGGKDYLGDGYRKNMDRMMANSLTPPSGTSTNHVGIPFSFDGFGMRADVEGRHVGDRLAAPTSGWLVNMFPQVGPARAPVDHPASKWPVEAIALSNSLLRLESLDTFHGLEVTRTDTGHDPRWNRVSSQTRHRWLNSKNRWLNYATTPGSDTNVFFCDADRRGVYSRSMLLGRVRKSEPFDLAMPNLPAPDHSLLPLHQTLQHLSAKVEDAGENRNRLMLSHVDYELRILIDTERHVILETEEHRNGKLHTRVVFSDFKTIAGRAWASKLATSRTIAAVERAFLPVANPNAQDRTGNNIGPALHLVSESTFEFRVLNAAVFAKRYEAELADQAKVQFLHVPLPNLADARETRTTGKADFDDHIMLADYFHNSGQWERVKKHMAAMATLAGDNKPGMWFIRNSYLREQDREAMRVRIVARARELAVKPTSDEFYMAGFLFRQMQQITAYNEQLEVLDILKPIYDRQPEIVDAKRAWTISRISVLGGLGRHDLVIELQHALAAERPWNAQLQTAYAYALVNHGKDHDSALAWLRKALKDGNGKWTKDQDEQIRNVISNFLESTGRYAEFLEHTREWMARNPDSYQVHARYLTALVWNDKINETEATCLKWIKAGVALATDEEFDEIDSFQPPVEILLPRDVSNRFSAALNVTMGRGYNLYTSRIDPKWLPTLARVVFAFARHKTHRDYANQVISHGHFSNTNHAAGVREQAFKVVNNELATLPPSDLQTFLRWSLQSTARIEREQWVDIADRLETRWVESNIDSHRDHIGRLLLNVMSSRLDMQRRLAFMRRQIKEGGKDYREGYIRALFNLLLAQPAWTDAIEVEAFAWLPKLSTAKVGQRMTVILPALYRLGDQMISQRYQTALQGVDHETKANRIAYRNKKVELFRAARAGFVKRLAAEIADAEKWLAAWMKIEHIYLSIKLGDDLKGQTKLVRQFLGDAPPARVLPKKEAPGAAATPKKLAAKDNLSTAVDPAELAKAAALQRERIAVRRDEATQDFFAGLLRHRYVMTAAHLASRRSSTKFIADALLKYCDAGIAMNPAAVGWAPPTKTAPPTKKNDTDKKVGGAHPTPEQIDALRIAQAKTARNLSWKSAKYRLLIALDRPQELERELLTWIKRDRQTAPWRLSLGRLLAEQGRLDEAVRLFKAVEHSDELRPSEYRALADWYLALDNREEHEDAKFRYYATMPEGRVSQRLSQHLSRYQATDGSAPATLDTDILLMIRALMEKSPYPANHMHHIRHFYATTKDFRLFQSVPIAALGQTAGHTYNMVSNAHYAFGAIMEEATVDEIVKRLREERDTAETEVDKRALDLLEVAAERRAIELENQAAPHVRPALAALKRAFEHDWAAGEHMMMANFLGNLGRMPQAELAVEQRRQMKQLYDWSKPATFERLQMAQHHANLLWNYDMQDEALIEIEAAIREFDQAKDGKWPAHANNILNLYFSKLQQKGRYADVESVILDHLTRPRNNVQIAFFEHRLDELYFEALKTGAQVSLGQGVELYRAYLARVLERLDSANDNLMNQLVTRVIDIFKIARARKWSGVSEDFRQFAYTRVPELLKRSSNNYRHVLNIVSQKVQEFFGNIAAIRYLLDRIDLEPPRFRYRNDDAWTHHASSLSGWLYYVIHAEKKTVPADLQARLLKMALDELRRDLKSHQNRGRYFYGRNYGYFWTEKQPEFLRVTEAILKERKQSGEAVAYIAVYLHELREVNRCIEIMFEAHRADLLNDNHINTLVSYLHGQKRFGESVPLLEGLVERQPNLLRHRTSLMQTYFEVDRKTQMSELLKATDEHFHKDNRWTEDTMAQLAGACFNCELFEASAQYYSNAIMEHRRTTPASAAGDSALSSYYFYQSNVFLRLNKTKEAVDASASAIVSWGRNHASRKAAVQQLQSVLFRVPDRDDYAADLDAEAERTQKDRPVVRKALGLAYQQKGEYAKAAAQLKIAAELQPNDAATHTALIACYDSVKNEQAAIDQTLTFLQLDRRNVETFAKLGQRLHADAKQQERAFTGMVEMKPNEADSHTKLAEIRQRQNRWDAAIDHWEHVVRIRSLEPTGLQNLIKAQIQARQFDDATRNIKKLRSTAWPPRFGSMHSYADHFERDIKLHRATAARGDNSE